MQTVDEKTEKKAEILNLLVSLRGICKGCQKGIKTGDQFLKTILEIEKLLSEL